MAGKPKQIRKLRHKSEFRRCYDRGRKKLSRSLVLFVLPNSTSKITRLGITASKKLGNSVQRNRAKRLMREAFKLSRSSIHNGYDIVMVGRKPILQMKCQEVQRELLRLLRRSKLLREK